jgi:hypothetical protein
MHSPFAVHPATEVAESLPLSIATCRLLLIEDDPKNRIIADRVLAVAGRQAKKSSAERDGIDLAV